MDLPSPPTFRRFVSHRSLWVLVALLCAFLVLMPHDFFLSPSDRLDRAATLFRDGLILEAEEELNPLLETGEGSPSVRRLQASVLLARGELRKARDSFLSLLRDAPHDSELALQLGFAQFYLGNLDSASLLGSAILRETVRTGDSVLQAQALHLLGRVEFNRARYDSSLRLQYESLRLARSVRSPGVEADALRQLGVLNWYRGNSDSALVAYYEPALELYRRGHYRAGEATTLSNIGLIHQQKGNWEKSLRYQLEALDIRKRIGDQIGLSDSYYALTHVPLPPKEARALLHLYGRRSLELSTRIGYAWGREVAVRQLDAIYRARLQLENPAHAWQDSLGGIMSSEGTLFAVQRKAWEFIREGSLQEAEPLLRRVAHLADSLRYTSLLITALTEHASILLELGKAAEARSHLTRALALGERDEPRHLPWIREKMADLLSREGRYGEAKKLLTSIVMNVDSLFRTKLLSQEPGVGFLTAISSIHRDRTRSYEQLITLLASRNDPDLFSFIEQERLLPFWGERVEGAETAASPLHRSSRVILRLLDEHETDPSRSGSLEELLAAAGELRLASLAEQRHLSLSGRVNTVVHPVAISQLASKLGQDEVFITYYVTTITVVAVVVRKERTETVILPIHEEELARLVAVHRATILRGADSPADSLWMGPARRLYQILIKPLEDRGLLRSGDHLVLSPHRSLHLVPFPSLLVSPRGSAPHFLIERYDLSFAPSATQWIERSKPQEIRSLLTFLPDPSSLPSAEDETAWIPYSFLPEQRVLRGDQATTSAFPAEATHYDVIHVAGHADLNQQYPLYSVIQCYDRGLELHEILGLSLRAALVVLSACESGVSTGAGGSIPSGHDLVSLPRAFLHAGAARVIASLWRVEDEATAHLMRSFYEAAARRGTTLPRLTFAEALNQSQRNWIESGRRRGSIHPFYWAGFTHIGAR